MQETIEFKFFFDLEPTPTPTPTNTPTPTPTNTHTPTPTLTPTPEPTPTNTPTPTPTLTPTPEPTPTPTPSPTSAPDSSTSNSNSITDTSSTPTVCSDTTPNGTPDLYQIDSDTHSATLFFTPISGADSYYISYGTTSSTDQFGTSFSYSDINGAVSYKVNSLQPATTYYFKVRSGNGCATGNWSQVVSATTQSIFTNSISNLISNTSNLLSPPNELEIVSSELVAKESNVCSYTVVSGDSLWSIADDFLSDGTKYTVLQDMNNTSDILYPGDLLQLPCDESEEAMEKAEKELTQEGITLAVKVLSQNNQPVLNATVTLHSKIQVVQTDQDGVAHFENVEPGEHKVEIAYNGYFGEQSLSVDGSKKEQELTIQIQLNNGFSSPRVLAALGGMGVVILVLLYTIFKLRHKQSHRE